MSALLRNVLHFSRLLHAAGLDVHAGRVPELASALAEIDIGSHSDFYFTLRALLIHRREDLQRFDEAFRIFWRSPARGPSLSPAALGERRQAGSPQLEFPLTGDEPSEAAPERTLSEPAYRTAPSSYSPVTISKTRDFSEFSEDELNEARGMLESLRWDPGLRRTRRWVPGPGNTPDLRRIIRSNMRYGGELLNVTERRRKVKRRPLVLICDISGSMERYSRMLLHFIHTLAKSAGRVEAFLFATRLTRITRELSNRSADEAVSRISRQVPDWSGGTRIGEALRTFNLIWARRTLSHGAVVLVISDGWDRGDPEQLRAEISRLRRSCHRLIWLNPLLGSREYQPLTRGIQAALPFIDDFMPVHNLVSMEALAMHLNALPSGHSKKNARNVSAVRSAHSVLRS